MASGSETGEGGGGRALRVLQGVGGGAVVVGLGAWLVATGTEVTVAHGAALGGGGAAALMSLAGRRIPAAVGATISLLAALAGYLALTWSYRVASFPYVDTVRPWGMDWGPYPVMRPTIGLLVILAALPGALGAVPEGVAKGARRARGALRAVGALACALVVAFWAVPRWYEMDLIAPEGVVPDLPHYLPRPGWVGQGDTPAVMGGALVRIHWSEYSFKGAPSRAISYVVHKELALASLAHGMHWSLADMKVASGALPAASAARQASVRGALWTAQRGASTGWLYLHLAAVPAWVFLAFRLVWGRPLDPLLRRGAFGILRVLIYGPPIVNLALLGGLVVTRLPDLGSGGARVLVESLGFLGCAALIDLGGRPRARRTEGA
ncbi:MAG: hypothetical protein Q8P41_10675 [Pseudomonadota bacterium]|nr:hypothetical protein [Pseudomonadota bacterium]